MLDSSELDFGGVRDRLIAFLQQQDRFRDYNFEGSNLRVLIDLLAYNTQMHAHYLHMVGSEMFLDTAQLRESVVSHAKELNYVPRSVSSAVAFVDLVVNVPAGPDRPETVVIPRYFPLRSLVGGVAYMFTTDDIVIVRRSSGYRAQNVPIYEGEVVRDFHEVPATGDGQYLIGAGADISSVRVHVLPSSASSPKEAVEWTRATSVAGVRATDRAFFVQAASSGEYQIVFGNGAVGLPVTPGNVVRVTYRLAAGSAANGLSSFVPMSAVDGFAVGVENVDASRFGQEPETIEDIKFRAPRFFATQDRAVTSDDFEVLLTSKFPGLEAAVAFGGEAASPPAYGKVFISAKPYGGTVLPNTSKRAIVDFVKSRSPLSIDPVYVDPDFVFVGVRTNVKYDAARTMSVTDLRSSVQLAVDAFGSANLNRFKAALRRSRLIAAIDDSSPLIVSNDTRVELIKRLSPPIRSDVTLGASFRNSIDVTSQHPTVYSTPFWYQTADGSVLFVRIEDDRRGRLMIVHSDSQGSKRTIASNVGTVDYAGGTVSIGPLVVHQYDTPWIGLHVVPARDDVVASSNQVMTIASGDVEVNVEAVSVP